MRTVTYEQGFQNYFNKKNIKEFYILTVFSYIVNNVIKAVSKN